MKTASEIAALVLVSAGMAAPLSADAQSESGMPPASEFYPLVGSWQGQGQLSAPGQPTVNLAMTINCVKASSGWAVRCEMNGNGDGVTMTESDLMGVDPVSGQAHWYAVTNQGETHDHLVTWTDPQTMKASYSWSQDGKQMQENITFSLKGKQTIDFTSAVTADGQPMGEFSGRLTR